jgi:hypothetical protein
MAATTEVPDRMTTRPLRLEDLLDSQGSLVLIKQQDLPPGHASGLLQNEPKTEALPYSLEVRHEEPFTAQPPIEYAKTQYSSESMNALLATQETT